MQTTTAKTRLYCSDWSRFLISQADQRILDWAQAVLTEPVPTLSAPQRTSGSAVSLYLTDILIEPTNRNERRHVLQAWLRYLITVNAETPEKAHGMLGTLLESAIDNPDFIVEAEQPSAEFWLALGVPPQPCLRVRVRAVKEIPLRPAKLVRKIRFETSIAQALQGTIVGPDDIPLAGAWVELPSLNQSCKTDHKGRFSFATTPVGTGPKLMVIRAKGREASVDLNKIRTGAAPVTVRIEMEE